MNDAPKSQNAHQAAALRGEPEAVGQGRWQPIETAPKDGTTIIVGRDMGDFGFIRGYARFEGAPGSFLSGWISNGFSEIISNLGLAHPTLWQPLPEPPQAASGCSHTARSDGQEMFPRCTEKLRAAGKAYPRTCAECGLGPCRITKSAEQGATPPAPAAPAAEGGAS